MEKNFPKFWSEFAYLLPPEPEGKSKRTKNQSALPASLDDLGELGEFSKVMQTLDCVSGLHNCLEFSQPPSCLDEAM